MERPCLACSELFEAKANRKWCLACLPPIRVIGAAKYQRRWAELAGFSNATYMKDWRAAHPTYDDAYNDARRMGEKPCVRCGALFALPRGQGGANGLRYCSTCRPIQRDLVDRKCRDLERHRQHLERVCNGGDLIEMQVLGERDGWICHICLLPVDVEATKLRLRPSVDHVVPVVQGGSHTWENVALAHHGCNARRHVGARELDPLMVFGGFA